MWGREPEQRPEHLLDPSERALEEVLAHPELFFAYYVLRDGGLRDVRVLFFEELHSAKGNCARGTHLSPNADGLRIVGLA